MSSLSIERVDRGRAVALGMALSALLSGDAAPVDAAVTDGPVVTWNVREN